jgi:DNA-binding NarL/FixJ family response regulator
MADERVRVLLADDHHEFAAEIASLLSREFEIVGIVGDGQALVEASAIKPDVVVTDLAMPKLSGIAAGRELLVRKACRAVIILTVHTDPELVEQSLKGGIRGYVLKNYAAEELIGAIYRVLEGGTFVSPKITRPFGN